MIRTLLFAALYCAGIGFANAAVRSTSSVTRDAAQQTTPRATSARTGATRNTANTVSRTASRTTTSRGAAPTVVRATTTVKKSPTLARSAISRTANTTSARTAASVSRSAKPGATHRAAITTTPSNTFGTGYNNCRDAYFTCMDQFCASQNESYRRCVCSSRLADIQSRERLLSQTATQLQDFKDLNIDVIPKTSSEVKAMLSATAGESAAANAKDTSASAQTLSGISAVLSGTKTKALSTQGTLDIAGDINSIWATTDLASGATIANLTGESLYNAVHSQCVELVASQCESQSTLQMVISAYGMYIENDCTTLSNALDKKTTTASGTVRQTEHEMHTARLENYDAHNSTAINDCIAQVRSDITADTACGANYVHCLDISGKYLNRDTGAPIYTASFYELGGTISLSGDILNNQTNRLIVAELNRKRVFAARGLETCRDLADEVWDEFMRQAITEIYQGQQSRIRDVKNECLDVVTQCYDEQNESLKDFSNVKEQLLLGARMELSEEMCKEKLNACANLYGGGKTGMQELLIAMRQITDQSIAQSCYASLLDYAKSICAVPSTDSLHSYPYGCRTYRPGEKKYAALPQCLITQSNKTNEGDNNNFGEPPVIENNAYVCYGDIMFTSCDSGYFLAVKNASGQWVANSNPQSGNRCIACPAGYNCSGGTGAPATGDDCGKFSGSLYQKIMRYARQTCVRPSLGDYDATPDTILQDANVVMDSIRVDMAKALATECERLGGTWVDTPWDESIHGTDRSQLKKFYTETSASTEWGFCADTAVDLAKSCTNSGGKWNAIESTCNCGSGSKYWDTIDLRCKQKDLQTACTMAGGNWDTDNKKCTCGDDASWDENEYTCKCNDTNKTWFGGTEKKCQDTTPTT